MQNRKGTNVYSTTCGDTNWLCTTIDGSDILHSLTHSRFRNIILLRVFWTRGRKDQQRTRRLNWRRWRREHAHGIIKILAWRLRIRRRDGFNIESGNHCSLAYILNNWWSNNKNQNNQSSSSSSRDFQPPFPPRPPQNPIFNAGHWKTKKSATPRQQGPLSCHKGNSSLQPLLFPSHCLSVEVWIASLSL